MDLPVAVRERRGLPGKGDHAFLAEQIKRILVPIQYQCHLVKLIGSLRGKPLTKIYKL